MLLLMTLRRHILMLAHSLTMIIMRLVSHGSASLGTLVFP